MCDYILATIYYNIHANWLCMPSLAVSFEHIERIDVFMGFRDAASTRIKRTKIGRIKPGNTPIRNSFVSLFILYILKKVNGISKQK